MPVHVGRKTPKKSPLRYAWDDVDPLLKLQVATPIETEFDRLSDSVRQSEQAEESQLHAAAGSTAVVVWDDVDRLVMRPNPQFIAPKVKRLGSRLRIAVYARFSSKGQNPVSIDIQVKEIVRYYTEELGGIKHTLFRDDARTGKNADRDGLKAMLEAVRRGEVDVVIVYTFDRLSRETYDGVPIIRFLEKKGVELHVARKNRRLSKREAVLDVVNSEEENELRRERMMNGIDRLVEDAGVPWGKHYGVDRSPHRGFPVRNKDKAEIVQRIVRDIVYKSGDAVARDLNADCIPAPRGGPWRGWMVLDIAKNIRNTGRIHFRRTAIFQDEEGEDYRDYNPEYNWKKGVNAECAIVTSQEFEAGKKAIAGRNTRQKGAPGDPSNHSLPIFGNPVCDCAGRDTEQRFILCYANERFCSHRYQCENGAAKCCHDAPGMMGDFIEQAIFDAVAARLEPQLDGFAVQLKESLTEISRQMDGRRADADAAVKKLVAKSRRLLRQDLQSSYDKQAREEEASDLKVKTDKARRRLALIPGVIAVDEMDFDGVQRDLSTSFNLLRGRLPFVPADSEEEELAGAMRKGVLGIRLSRTGRLRGSIGISIAVQWQRYFLSEETVVQYAFEPEIIETECYLPPNYNNEGSWAHMSELAAEGLHALTDEQWALICNDLPDLTITYSGKKRVTETRNIVHLLLFMTRMRVPLTRPPSYFGDGPDTYKALLRLVKAGGIEVIRRKLCVDTAWAEGLDFSRYDKLMRSVPGRTQGTLNAARRAEIGDCGLSDEQWQAVEHLFTARLSAPAGSKPAMISMRTAMEGVLIKLKTGCNWRKLPPRFGVGNELFNIAQRMQYHGVWDAVFDIFVTRFPEVMVGVLTEQLRGWVPRRGIKRVPPLRTQPVTTTVDLPALPPVSGAKGRRQGYRQNRVRSTTKVSPEQK